MVQAVSRTSQSRKVGYCQKAHTLKWTRTIAGIILNDLEPTAEAATDRIKTWITGSAARVAGRPGAYALPD